MNCKLIFLVFFVWFVNQSLWSQVIISGKVVSQVDNQPLSFATLQLLDSSNNTLIKYTTTDFNGIYNFKISEKGVYKLKITHISHEVLWEEVNIDSSEHTINFILQQNINALKEVILDFEPKVMKVFNDTITYNLKALTNGNEKNLSDILEKLPGVKINNSGRISVNGKIVKKLLIDGEELFKNQHQTTTESVSAKMIEGIRYLDKYNDFGNITGFDNKQTNALDVSIKDEYKNKITGDFKLKAGYKDKYLANANLFRFGGRVKLGFIGNWNTLGKQSITSQEYNELKGIGFEEVDQNGFSIKKSEDDSPKFLDPTIDVASRDNIFGVLSAIYKPSIKTKISLLHIYSKTKQSQLFLNDRQFFDFPELNILENKTITSDFLLNTTILNLGYQPNEKSFIEYNFSFNPQNSKQLSTIHLNTDIQDLNIVQNLDNAQYLMDQKLSFLNRLTPKTLLKFTGLYVKEDKEEGLHILSNNNILSTIDGNTLLQLNNIKKDFYGYQLQSVTNIKKNKLRFEHGIIFTESVFETNANDNQSFINNYDTDRMDSYFNASFDRKLNKRIKVTGSLGYNFIHTKRFDNSFRNTFFKPSISFLYKPNPSKMWNFDYSYTVDLPSDNTINNANIIENYYTLKTASEVKSDQLLPEHKFSGYYSYNNHYTGSSFSTFASYNFAPQFISTNNISDADGNVLFNNFTGNDKHTFNYSLRFDKRFKNKLGLYTNFNFYFAEQQNKLDDDFNLSKNIFFKNKLGAYSRYRKGVNFNLGLDFEISEFETSLQNNKTKSSIIKPYLIINGDFLKEVLTWNLGSNYAIYKTDLVKESVLNIYPSVVYIINDDLELTLTGNNIFNIKNARITQNYNTTTYSESSIIDTLEGYIVFGVLLKI